MRTAALTQPPVKQRNVRRITGRRATSVASWRITAYFANNAQNMAGPRTTKLYLAGQGPPRAAQKNKLRRLKFYTSFRHERCHVLFQPLVVPKCEHDYTSHDRSHRNG
jgi:hypothetical protein